MLACEVGDLQKDLSKARRNVHQLVRMHTEAAKEHDVLALEVIRLKWELSDKLKSRWLGSSSEDQSHAQR